MGNNRSELRDDARSLDRQLASAKTVLLYLEEGYPGIRRADEAAVSAFLESIASVRLSEAEVLQILNLMPSDPVIFYKICQDCDERFSEDQVDELCALVVYHLLGGPPPQGPSAFLPI